MKNLKSGKITGMQPKNKMSSVHYFDICSTKNLYTEVKMLSIIRELVVEMATNILLCTCQAKFSDTKESW